MKLLTQELMAKLPPIYSQDGLGDDAIVQAKFFTPWARWTWYATEADALVEGDWVPLSEVGASEIQDVKFFGLVHGNEEELGYFLLSEMESLKGPWGLKIERDLYWDPIPVGKCRGGRL